MTSTAQLQQAVTQAKKFYLHRLLVERMQQLARDENAWQLTDTKLAAITAAATSEADAQNDGPVHPSVEGLMDYEQAVAAMRISLKQRDSKALPKQFHDQHMGLFQCSGHLYDQHKQAPYAEPLNKLFAGHNVIGELLRRDAFIVAEQKLAEQLPTVAELKKILQQQPPKKLYEYPEIRAVSEFNKEINQPDLTPEQYQQALKKLQRGVFNG